MIELWCPAPPLSPLPPPVGINITSQLIMLYKVVTDFPSVDEILELDHLKGQYHGIFSNTLKIEKTLFG